MKMEATGGVQGAPFHHPWHEQPEELVAMTEARYYYTVPTVLCMRTRVNTYLPYLPCLPCLPCLLYLPYLPCLPCLPYSLYLLYLLGRVHLGGQAVRDGGHGRADRPQRPQRARRGRRALWYQA
mgnify:CR=1 FL=1